GQSGTAAIVINKADATVSVTGYTGTYNGNAHGATGSATGVKGESLSGLDLGDSFTNVLGGTANWSFAASTNYNGQSGTAAIVINKANATIVVTPYSVTYNGAAHTATGKATGVGGATDILSGLDLGGTTHTAAGTYATDPWSFTDVTGNYNDASGTTSDSIAKANATIVVTPYSVTYNGAAHTATGKATGVGGATDILSGLDLGGTTHTAAGTYATDPWGFTDVTGNYNDASGTTSDSIAKANATIVVTPYSVTYNGAPHTATGKATGVEGATEILSGLDLGGTTHTAAGTYATDAWSFTDVTGNYNNDNGTVSDSIAKADATIVVTPYSVTYNGAAHSAAGTATGVKGEALTGLNLGGTTHTNAGTYNGDPWSFSNDNYNDATGTVDDSIAKANATIIVNGYIGVYDGKAHGASGSATGVEAMPANLSSLLDLGATYINVPGGTANWNFAGNDNYNPGSGSVAIVLTMANATIVVTPYNVTYDGVAHTATFSAKGVKGENLSGMNVTNTTHTNAGTYNNDPWTFTDGTGNYNNANGAVNDKIGTAALTITADSLTKQYSDPVTFTVKYLGFVNGETESVLGGTLTFNPTSANAQFLAPSATYYTIIPSGLTSGNYAITYVNGTLTEKQEDARADYSGMMFASTTSTTGGTANVTLSATIRDITAVTNDPAYDTFAGDIRNAKVTFVIRNGASNTIINATPASVYLVDPTDLTTGTATITWNPNIGTAASVQYTIGIIVNGYYTRDASTDNTVVTVSKLTPGSINGGGYLVMQNSAGQVAGGVGTKNNFGFNVKNDVKSGPKGNINTIIRNGGKVYQIKGNAMTSLSTTVKTTPTALIPSTATFNGKANIQDITNPLAPISLGGNCTLQVTMSDAGEPGKSDSIAITVWNGTGALWFSSNWNGTKTAEQIIGGGNLVVR
ncbi:MAG: hypothetical protein H0X73_08315, partial [Chthoniobacterales bacterium]|nr:hypothetical protein [Chthoniobacterales bacterium]